MGAGIACRHCCNVGVLKAKAKDKATAVKEGNW